MIVKVIVLKIVYIGVLMRLVSITHGHVKFDWLPPPKVDRVNESDKDNKSDKSDREDKCNEGEGDEGEGEDNGDNGDREIGR